MQVAIKTLATVDRAVLMNILNVAIDGGCAEWADVSERRAAPSAPQLCASARFAARSNAAYTMVISEREIAAGIELALNDGDVPEAQRAKLLRVVAMNDSSEVDLAVAGLVVQAVMHRAAAALTA